MSSNADTNAGRRHFLIGLAVVAGGVTAGRLHGGRFFPANNISTGDDALAGTVEFKPHAFVRIDSHDVVTVIVGKSEMGQGIATGLAIPLAEELDIDPQRVRVEFAPADKAFANPRMGMQMTAGSQSTNSMFTEVRQVGALARAVLLTAAAQRWGVNAAGLHTSDGTVTDGSRSLRYGDLAAIAATLPVPKTAPLKDASQFRYIGKSQHRLDGPAKVTGKAVFGMDVDLPDMLFAMVARPPMFGGKLRSFDATAARAVPGVVDVRQVPSGVAVYATNTWAARRGREALQLQWDHAGSKELSTAQLRGEWRRLSRMPGSVAQDVGNVDEALAGATRRIDVEYEVPYLAHACMEPMNCTAHVTPQGCEIWVGTQAQTQEQILIGQALGIAPDKVKVNTMFLGGGFGRRASNTSDFAVEAALVANGMGRPVKTVWTREDDIRGGYYRPYSITRIRAAVDAAGLPLAVHHCAVSQSVMASSMVARRMIRNGIDPSIVDGAAWIPYAVPNHRVELHTTENAVPVLWWRSVGQSTNGFITNALIDELAELGGRDPVALRRLMLVGKPKFLAVLDKAVSESGYGVVKLPAGHAHGVALQESSGSIVAQVAEVSIENGVPRVHRVTCAIDCGLAVNPDQVVAQMQSSVIFGMSAALHGEITLDEGQPQQANFNDYPVMRMNEAPAIDVHIIPSSEHPMGVGEPGVPPIAAAVCNALFTLTGKRIRRLPIQRSMRS